MLPEGVALLVQHVALGTGKLAPMLHCVCPALWQAAGQLDAASLGALQSVLEAVTHTAGSDAPAAVTCRYVTLCNACVLLVSLYIQYMNIIVVFPTHCQCSIDIIAGFHA